MGSVFSVVLILPSWGSAINMLLTMKGEWNQLTENPLIKFMVLASTFYMLSTLEGPIQAVKSVNAMCCSLLYIYVDCWYYSRYDVESS